MPIESFLKLNPPTFIGTPLIDDPQLFLDRTNKVLRTFKCPSDREVKLVAYNLNRPAKQLYETLLEGRNASRLPFLT